MPARSTSHTTFSIFIPSPVFAWKHGQMDVSNTQHDDNTTHNLLEKKTVTVQPVPCNYSLSQSCYQGLYALGHGLILQDQGLEDNKSVLSMTWVHCVCMGRNWPGSDWHGSQAVANSSSHLHWGNRWLLWTQPEHALMNSLQLQLLHCVSKTSHL